MTGKTLREVRDERETLGIYCDDPVCCHRAMLDTDDLIARLGENYGAMHGDLVHLFYCTKCRAAGRPDKRISFRTHQDYDWIRQQHRKPEWRASK